MSRKKLLAELTRVTSCLAIKGRLRKTLWVQAASWSCWHWFRGDDRKPRL